jgi:hypothetical protein
MVNEMKIIGFNLSKISGIRVDNLSGNLEITQNIDIKNIIEEDIAISKEKALKISFNFSINYSNEFAKIEFEGIIMALPEKNELKEVIKQWKDKKIPEDFRVPLFNFIMAKCNVKALSLEDELNLPTHFQMPRIDMKK